MKVLIHIVFALVVATFVFSGYASAEPPAKALSDLMAKTKNPEAALNALPKYIFSLGPNGATAVPASTVKLTGQEIAKIKSKHATAAIVMHYLGNNFAQGQIAGLKAEFRKMGIKVIAVTNAHFSPSKQVSDIETVLARHPDIIVSIPTDPQATAKAYREAEKQGVKLVFMDNVPAGFKAGKDYVSDVSADNYGNGVAAALLMANALNGQGKIGLVYYSADFFVTNERYDAFKTTIKKYFPHIKIVAQQGIAGPNFSSSAERAASGMMTSHPDLDGIWAVWAVPAEGVISAARENSRDNLIITTCDLGQTVAINMARDSYVKGLGSQRPYDQGETEAKLAGYGLLGKKAPAYVALPSLPVTKHNLLDAWQKAYHAQTPAMVRKSMK